MVGRAAAKAISIPAAASTTCPSGRRRTCLGRLALRVTVKDLTANAADLSRVQGTFWEVTAVDPSDTGKPIFPPLHQSLPEAVEHCLRHLGSALRAGVPADPTQPLRIPQQPAPVDEPTDPEPSLRRLARNHPGEPITIRL
ncbi:hypothetical protein [Micromonospora pisi]|uniref:hypothetical protein n=1 Tax=Micromonospora pisi TaxID=589240 RepID=UPI0011C42855|nr:hypothetical protein [Micromonospora pisi]